MSAQSTSQRRAGVDIFAQVALGKLTLCRYLASSEGHKSINTNSRGSRLMSRLLVQTMYEKRQMVLLAIAHAIATLVVWQHFFYIKFLVQEAKVPVGANLYWWKRLTPPFEFGAMHAILFQMALLPLTMARSTVAYVAQTYIGKKFIPLHRVVAMHRVRFHDCVLRVLWPRMRRSKVRERTVAGRRANFLQKNDLGNHDHWADHNGLPPSRGRDKLSS